MAGLDRRTRGWQSYDSVVESSQKLEKLVEE